MEQTYGVSMNTITPSVSADTFSDVQSVHSLHSPRYMMQSVHSIHPVQSPYSVARQQSAPLQSHYNEHYGHSGHGGYGQSAVQREHAQHQHAQQQFDHVLYSPRGPTSVQHHPNYQYS